MSVEILLVIEPAAGGRYEHRLLPGVYTLGREAGACDIAIHSPEVSRQHLRLTLSSEGCTVEDLGSTAGTFHEGRSIAEPTEFPLPLALTIGTTRLGLSLAEYPAAVAVTAHPDAGPNRFSAPVGFTGTAGHYTKGREIAR